MPTPLMPTLNSSAAKIDALMDQISAALQKRGLMPKVTGDWHGISYIGNYFVNLWIMPLKGKRGKPDRYELRIGTSERLRWLSDPFEKQLEGTGSIMSFVLNWIDMFHAEMDYELATNKFWLDVKAHLMADHGKDSDEASTLTEKALKASRKKGMDILKEDPSDVAYGCVGLGSMFPIG